MLVVIAIIGALSSLLISSVIGAKQTVRSTVCSSNLRQVSMGLFAFAEERTGRAPGSGTLSPYGTGWGMPPQWPRWVGGMQSAVLDPSQSVAYSEFYAGQSNSLAAPALGSLISNGYIGSKQVFMCPASLLMRNAVVDNTSKALNQYFPYGMNFWYCGSRYGRDLCGEYANASNPSLPSTGICPPIGNDVADASLAILVVDHNSGFDYAWRSGTSIDGGRNPACLNIALPPHKKQVNAVYCDGHVAPVRVFSSISGFETFYWVPTH